MPRVWLWNVPAPKSGWSVTDDPMKLMMFAELASTCAVEMSVFHRLVDGKGTKPFKFAPCPRLIAAQVPDCAMARPHDRTKRPRLMARSLRIDRIQFPFFELLRSSGWGLRGCVPNTEARLTGEDEMALPQPCVLPCASIRISSGYVPSSTSLLRPNFSGTGKVWLMVGCQVMP